MMDFQAFGKILLSLGLVLVVLGGCLVLAGKLPWIGKLPGDIWIERKYVQFYFPLATCLLLSVFLSLLFYLFRR